MGAYRSKPITDKVSSDESGKYVKCGASSMQGWRVTQEDAHNCIIEFDENTSLFAVYDGHGGHEVAQYCSETLPQYLKECASYKSSEYTKALKEAFLGFDATLVEPSVVKVLNNIVKSADDEVEESENQNSGSEDEENIRNLYEEAQMPLEEVMAKYQTDGLNPALKKLKAAGGTPPSPYLVAKQCGKAKFSEEAAGSSKAGGSSSSSTSSSSGSSSSSSTSSGSSGEPAEESSNESAEKEGEESKKGEKEEEKITDRSRESNGEKAHADSKEEANGDQTSEKRPDPNSDKSAEKSEDASSDTTSQKSKDGNEKNASEEAKSENVKEEEKVSKEEPKVVKDEIDNHLKEGEKEKESGKKEETKDVKQDKKKSPIKKLEVNGDVEPKDLKKESTTEPHENGDVGDEETEDDEDEKETTKSRKGKGKAIVKKSERPKRTSARQRNMAILFRSLLAAQDSADSESDDEGDESFQGAEERSSSEDEDKEEAEAEGEDEEGEEGDEEEEDGEEEEEEEGEEEEEEEEDEEDLPKIAKGNFEQPGVESGCTAVVALLHGRDLYVANAGDSRCIVSRAGEALDMSLDHKPEDDIEIERIVAAGGFVSCDGRVNGGLNLSRAIGDHAYKQTENLPPEEQMITALPDVRTLSIDTEKDEFMVLACDGIWNSMTSQEVVNFVRARLQSGEEKLLSQICEELFDFCLAPDTASDGTGCDNMTAVIVQFLPILAEAKSSDLPNTSISTATNKRPASPTENSDSSVKRFKTGVV